MTTSILLLVSILTIIWLWFVKMFVLDIYNKPSIAVVVSRYNEKLEWIETHPFNQFNYIVYNKGTNDDFCHTNVVKVIHLPNVGRESHTYLYHIVHNYNHLSDINVFLPGSVDTTYELYRKKEISAHLLNTIASRGNAVFLTLDNDQPIYKKFYDFTLDTYEGTTAENLKNNSKNLVLSTTRPFGRWIEHNNICQHTTAYIHFGIFSVHKNDIRRNPLEYYKQLMTQLEVSSNPEVGHYFERSWAAIFSPLSYTEVVVYNE